MTVSVRDPDTLMGCLDYLSTKLVKWPLSLPSHTQCCQIVRVKCGLGPHIPHKGPHIFRDAVRLAGPHQICLYRHQDARFRDVERSLLVALPSTLPMCCPGVGCGGSTWAPQSVREQAFTSPYGALPALTRPSTLVSRYKVAEPFS